jgi:hypothetical protein
MDSRQSAWTDSPAGSASSDSISAKAAASLQLSIPISDGHGFV